MNLNSLLNHDPGSQDDGHQRNSASSTNSRAPSLPALNTTYTPAPAGLYQQTSEPAYPSHLPSPSALQFADRPSGMQYNHGHFRSPAAYSHPSHPPQIPAPLPQNQPSQQLPSRPSLSRTPSSSHDVYPQPQRQTPTSSHSHHSSTFAPPHPPSHGSPMIPPPRRPSVQHHPDAQPQAFYRTPSVVPRSSGPEQPYLTPSHPSAQPLPPSTNPSSMPRTPARSPSEGRVVRQDSMSVSPKTIVMNNVPSTPSRELSAVPGGTQYSNLAGAEHQHHAYPPTPTTNYNTQPSVEFNASSNTPATLTPQQSLHLSSRPHNDHTSATTPASNKVNGTTQSHALSTGQKRPVDVVSSPSSPPPPVATDGPSKRARMQSRQIPAFALQAKNSRPFINRTGKKQNVVAPRATNGRTFSPQVAAQSTPTAIVDDAGVWDCFTGIIPYEHLTREVSNFLYATVVSNHSVGGSEIGEAASVQGQLEIEARLGSLINRDTHARLQLPVLTETLLAPQFDVAFESLMGEEQHKTFNDFLNSTVKESHRPLGPGDKPRAKIRYEHLREADIFIELPSEEVKNFPPVVQAHLHAHPNLKPRLRVTLDQKTGAILAKIVKLRVQDLHVYCPSQPFDWRVSVSLEMNWNGDLDRLLAATGQREKLSRPDRRKDRVSYRHGFCQIDLTQVKLDAGPPSHELEVELSASEVKKQGKLASEGLPNKYEDLVRAFLDNVRVLSRVLKQQ